MHSQVGVSACQFPNPSVPSERPLQCCVVLLFHPGVSSCTPAVPVLLVLGNFAGRSVDPSLIPPARAPEDLVPGNTLSNMPVIHITGCIFSYTFLVRDRAGDVGCSSAQHKVKPSAGLGGLGCVSLPCPGTSANALQLQPFLGFFMNSLGRGRSAGHCVWLPGWAGARWGSGDQGHPQPPALLWLLTGHRSCEAS